MDDAPVPRSASARFEAALDASCDALMELELIRAHAGEVPSIEPHASRAVRSLQRAIAEFRSACQLEPEALDVGFVIASESDPQSRPRRTA